LAEKALETHRNAYSEVVLKPSSGGVFEVSLNGVEMYSKIKTGEFPVEDRLLKEIAAKL